MDRPRVCSTVLCLRHGWRIRKLSRWALEGVCTSILTGWNPGFMREDGRFQQYVDLALALMQDCNEATRITIAVAYVLL
jgi:hypothetical protein